jgi:hypothetical protein
MIKIPGKKKLGIQDLEQDKSFPSCNYWKELPPKVKLGGGTCPSMWQFDVAHQQR